MLLLWERGNTKLPHKGNLFPLWFVGIEIGSRLLISDIMRQPYANPQVNYKGVEQKYTLLVQNVGCRILITEAVSFTTFSTDGLICSEHIF